MQSIFVNTDFMLFLFGIGLIFSQKWTEIKIFEITFLKTSRHHIDVI